MTPLQIAGSLVAIIGGLLGIFVVLAKAGDYVLSSFHSKHVEPAITNVKHAIEKNTDATERVASALGETKELQMRYQHDTGATFDRMGKIIEDHEERITALEPQPTPKATPRIRGRKS